MSTMQPPQLISIINPSIHVSFRSSIPNRLQFINIIQFNPIQSNVTPDATRFAQSECNYFKTIPSLFLSISLFFSTSPPLHPSIPSSLLLLYWEIGIIYLSIYCIACHWQRQSTAGSLCSSLLMRLIQVKDILCTDRYFLFVAVHCMST